MYLSPISFLIEDIKGAFTINSQSFFSAIHDLAPNFDKKITIKIVSNRTKGIGVLKARCNVETGLIEINECLLCAIWAASYFVGNAFVSLNDYLSSKNDKLNIETVAMELVDYAKSLQPSYADWHEELPIPQDYKTNQYADLANLITPIAVDVILCHELAHLFLHHTPNGGKQQEIDADNLAIDWIIDSQREPYPIKELAVMTSFASMILVDISADKGGKHHPSSFLRIMNYIDRLGIEENDVLWALAILIYRAWEKSFRITEFDSPSRDVSFRQSFISII